MNQELQNSKEESINYLQRASDGNSFSAEPFVQGGFISYHNDTGVSEPNDQRLIRAGVAVGLGSCSKAVAFPEESRFDHCAGRT